ncbi:glycosyltransferase family 9 protein [bacterium]|nr:glycosyltransferase family 9 protein [bacterium]
MGGDKVLEAKKILIVKLGSIGDVIHSLPFLKALRDKYPKSFIAWTVESKAYPILEGHSSIDEIILFDRRNILNYLRKIRSYRFDLVIDLQRLLKSGLITYLSKAKNRLGFDKKRCKEYNYLFTNLKIPSFSDNKHIIYQYLEFADYLGIKDVKIKYDLFIPDLTRKYKDIIKDRRSKLIINIGASKKANIWFPELFAELIETIKEQYKFNLILTGGASDRTLAKEIKDLTNVDYINLVGKTTLKELAFIIKNGHLYIGCDTGPTHLAVAVNTPVIGLYGSSNPKRNGPLGYGEYLIYKDLDCAPCRKKECQYGDNRCMREIKVKDVMEKINLFFNKNY